MKRTVQLIFLLFFILKFSSQSLAQCTLVFPPNITVNTAPGVCQAYVNITTPYLNGAPLSCNSCWTYLHDQQTSNFTIPAGSPTTFLDTFPLGTTTVFWVGFIQCDNFYGSFTQTITVVDNQPPVFPAASCPKNITLSAPTGSCQAQYFDQVGAFANDNCAGSVQATNNYNGLTNLFLEFFPVGTTIVTWTAVDNVGNSSTCNWTIQVFDFQPPSITCPPSQTISTAPNQCSRAFNPPPATVSDNCPGVTQSDNAPPVFPLGQTVVTYTVEDASGNISTCTLNVFVVDQQAPVLTCQSGAISLNNTPGLCGRNFNMPSANLTDNCPGATQSNNAPSFFPIGTTTVTFNAFDAAGNSASPCTRNVIVSDNQVPVITCPANITQPAATGACQATVSIPPATATDNCAIQSITRSPTQNIFPVGTTVVTWTALDVNGNTATCTMTVTITDNQPPTMICPNNVTTNANPGTCISTFPIGDPTTSDNCGFDFFTSTPPGPWPLGTTTIVFTGFDDAGNTSTCSMTITVLDNQPPVLTCPPNLTANTNPGVCTATVNLSNPTSTDNCPGTTTFTNNAPSPFPIGLTTVTFTGTDNNGNSSTCQMSVLVVDNQNPVISCPASISQSADPGVCDADVTVPPATATDNCGIEIISSNPNLTNFPVGTTNIVWTAQDLSGNTATCQMSVTITDDEPPTIVCPNNLTVFADAGTCVSNAVLGNPTTDDNCTFDFFNQNPTAPFPLGTTTVTFTGFDISGNSSTCSMTITVLDNQAPVLTCPPNLTVNTNPGVCTATVNLSNPTATDNCPGTTTFTNNAPSPFPIGTTTVTFFGTDANGNSSTCSMSVLVVDNQNPVISCPASISQSADPGVCDADVTVPPATATDNCGIEIISSNPNLTNFPVGTTNIVWTAVDFSGNSATCQMSVTITDDEPPVLDCPSNISVGTDPGNCTAVVVLPDPVGTDNCGFDFSTNDAPNPFPVGTTTVTFTGFDINGNSATCTTTVTVTDDQAPNLTCPPNLTVNNDPGVCTADLVLPDPTATDNCPGAFVFTNNAPSPFPLGNTTVIFTGSDDDGNSSTCTVLVMVVDNEAPVINFCPPDQSVFNTPGLCSAVVAPDVPEASDNCSAANQIVFSNNAPAGNVFPVGNTVVIFTATDAAGNTATCTANIEVVDNEPAVIICPPNLTLSTAPDECVGYAFLDDPTITDNCDDVSNVFDIVQVPDPANGDFPVGMTTVTFFVYDVFGNEATCTTTVTVNDTQAPEITCPPDITTNTDPGTCTAFITFPPATVNENCPNSLILTAPQNGTYGVGNFQAIYTASDGTSSDSCTINITVIGSSNLTITCPPNDTVPTDPGQCFATLTLPNASASAVCGVDTITNNAPATFPLGLTTVIFTVTDLTGQTASCSMTVLVLDNQPPVLTCPANIVQPTDPNSCLATVAVPAPIFSENCPAGWLVPGDTVLQNVPIGTLVFTFSATDGNQILTCSLNITVTGTTAFTISCPQNVTVNTDPGQCFATLTLPNATATAGCGLDTITNNAPATFPLGTTTVIFVATDNAGSTVSCQMTVTVLDNQPPSVTCPPTIFQNVDAGICTATVSIFAAANDNCSQVLSSNFFPQNPFPIGTTTVTVTTTDDSGNTATCTLNVIISENTPPVLTCPANISVGTDPGICSATIDFSSQISISDNCGTAPSIIAGQTSGIFPLGLTTVNLTASDGNGNTATCQITIFVADDEAPILICPPPIVQPIDLIGCVATVVIPPATATDNCTFPIVPTGSTGGTFPIGISFENFTATDAAGNSSTCSVQITITGTPNLTIVCPAAQVLNNDPGQCFANLNLPDPVVVATCGLNSLTNDAPNPFPIGQTVVIFSATDAVGGVISCSTTVTVNDIEAPTLICPPNIALSATVPVCSAVASFSLPELIDNCPLVPGNLTSNIQNGQILAVGTHQVNFLYTSGAATTGCNFQIIVSASPTFSNLNLTICEGDTAFVGGQIFTVSGNFTTVLPNLIGCDSTISLNLNVNPTVIELANVEICEGDSILLGGIFRKTAGIYQDFFQSQLTGCDSILQTTLSINPKPIFEIMGPLSLCPGVSTVLTAGIFAQFLWSPGGETTPTISIDQPGIYAATVTDNLGCSASDEIDIVSYCGAVFADFEANRDTACTDFIVQFTDKSTGMPAAPNKWFWDFGNGNSSSEQNPFTYYPTPGTYSVRLIVSDNFVSDTVERDIFIYPKIDVGFSQVATNVCTPTELQFSGMAAATFPVINWTWSFGDGTGAVGQNPKHEYGNYDTVLTQLVVMDNFGCTDSLSKDVKISPNGIAPLPVTLTPVLCPGESITINGTLYNENNLFGQSILPSFHGCDSVVNVQLSYIPGGNISLGADTSICENQSLTLDAGAATNYKWSTGATTKTITVSAAGKYSVTISAGGGNCQASGEINVAVDVIPNLTANAGLDQTICATSQFVKLNAQNPTIGTGAWSISGTSIIDNQASAQSFVSNLTSGQNQFTWTLSNGACKNYSTDAAIVNVVSPISESAFAGNDVAFCQTGGVVQLDADPPAGAGLTGMWSQPAGQNLTIADPTNPKTTVTGLNATDIYILFWKIGNGVCADSSDEVLISRSPNVLKDANAGDNVSLCDKTEVAISGNTPGGSFGKWTVVGNAGTAIIGNQFDPTTMVTGIAPGTLQLVWTLSTSQCGNYSSDTLTIFQSGGLKANNDGYDDIGQPLTGLNFVANDEVGVDGNVTVNILTTPNIGTLTKQPDGTFDFAFGQVKHENVSFKYQICLKTCPDICSEATVEISTNGPVPLMIRPANVMTPNGDNVGDFFEIPNFEEIPPPITLSVFNRWGDVVFQIDAPGTYLNNWNGVDNDGNELPEGTYFYVLRGGGGDNEETGYVTILR